MVLCPLSLVFHLIEVLLRFSLDLFESGRDRFYTRLLWSVGLYMTHPGCTLPNSDVSNLVFVILSWSFYFLKILDVRLFIHERHISVTHNIHIIAYINTLHSSDQYQFALFGTCIIISSQ